MKNKLICLFLILAILMSFVGCNKDEGEKPKADTFINGVNVGDYSIVYSDEDYDYSKRAAEYIKDQILARTDKELPIIEDSEAPLTQNEIVVGETEREISKSLTEKTEGLEFLITANDSSIALKGDLFIIAAAAYYFIETYIPTDGYSAEVAKEVAVHTPIVKEAKSFIMLIGDGMGEYQTRMFEYFENDLEYGEGEDIFYGYYLPYKAYSRTESLSGVTDSAAGGTALSSGHKTYNEYIGRDKDLNDVKNLCELASEKGKAAGVMSTENKTGATPASFSAHADSRGGTTFILDSQLQAQLNYGLQLECGFDYYNTKYMGVIEKKITTMLDTLDDDEDGFFLMYEEAHIDKHCHKNYLDQTFNAMVRFNQAIGVFMEYAFYHPDTFVLITADHETGDLYPNEEGVLEYHSEEHTAHPVPVFVYGHSAELFDGKEVENIQIAHTIAHFMGEDNFGDQSEFSYLK